MLTPDQLAAIKQRSIKVTRDSLQHSREDIFTLVNEVERLTRHNQRMSAALAQLSDGENWYYYDGWGWCGAGTTSDGPQQLAERALVEDG